MHLHMNCAQNRNGTRTHTHTDRNRHRHRQNDCQLQATNAFNSKFWHNNIMSIIKWLFACSFLVPDINANK